MASGEIRAAAYDQLIGPELEAYCGQCFEGLSRQALPRLYRREPVHGSFDAEKLDLVGVAEAEVGEQLRCIGLSADLTRLPHRQAIDDAAASEIRPLRRRFRPCATKPMVRAVAAA